MDRNINPIIETAPRYMSPPARVAWIETLLTSTVMSRPFVATREGGVDRNRVAHNLIFLLSAVATREGGVDRNMADYEFVDKEGEGRHPRGWRG